MAILQTVELSQKNYRLPEVVYGVCGDTGRRLEMVVIDVQYSSGVTGEVHFIRPDGSYYHVNATYSAPTNSFTIDLTQLLTRYGIVKCILKVINNGETLSTYPFKINCQQSPEGMPEEQAGYTIEEMLTATRELMDLYEDVAGIFDEVEDARRGADGVDYASLGEAIRTQLETKASGAYVQDGVAYFTNEAGEVLYDISGLGGGGGGGSESIVTVANNTGWLATTISEQEQCWLSFTWSSVEDDFPTGDGTMTVRVNGLVKVVQNVSQGNVTVNVRDYLSSGSNSVRVTFSDVYSKSKSIVFSISLVALSISADSFAQSNASAVYDGPVSFTYVPIGAVSKNVIFKLDNNIIGTQEVTTSGRQQTFNIPVQSHGAHYLEVYFTAIINEVTVSSNHLFFDLIFVEDGDDTPIISSSFNADGATQYYTIAIPYRVYTPSSATSEVLFTATVTDEFGHTTTQNLGTRTVPRAMQTFTYTPTTVGTLQLMIRTGEAQKVFELSVARLDIDVEAETDSLELYLSAAGRSNSEARPNTWTYNDISCTFTNFNFVSDGWQLDDMNSTYLKVSGNARLMIPFQLFANDFKGTGKTIEFDFSTTDVMNYGTTIVSCFADGKGLTITPQSVALRSESIDISTQYKEDEHVRISFVIEKTSENRLVYTYINGICSGLIQYPSGDDFQQTNPVDISIGSNDCTINLYTIRSYNNSLTRHQILNNWIADTPDGATMLARYNHNNIYDEYGDIVINKLPTDLPYLIVESAALPQYKGDKKTISGSYTNPVDPTKSFTFTNASMDVQGTSSAGYPRKNYKIKYKNFTNEDGETSNVYYLRGATESLPTNVFCYKADYASSEGANNVELVKLYNDACPYKTEPQEDNALVRQGIDGLPILIFWNDTNAGTISFLGKYNFNFDKDSKVFGMEDGDESWETKDNSNDWALFKRADYNTDDWETAFEARYPEDYNDPTNLAALASWIYSTDPVQATGDTLTNPVTYEGTTYTTDSADYRVAKFRNELTNWFNRDDVLFYYLFTELFLMVDSRVKNSFPTLYASHEGAKWCWLPYDMDTAIGINNEGALAFDYSLEDTDMLSPTAGVYNGYQTVMWNNVRRAFPNELASLYQSVRAEGIITYEEVEQRFENHQNTWNEAIFNEDAYFKYIRPFVEDGENNLYMCLGSKAEQRKWWLYNRFRYIDSKYTAGYATTATLQMRVYQRSNLSITPYADIYASALFDSNLVKERATRGQATTLIPPAGWNPGGADAVLRIYSADQIKSLGDLSGFYVGAVSFAGATKLQNVKLGDADPNYANYNLTEVTFGTNSLLTDVDIRNCPSLTGTIDLSHCENLEVLHMEGTSIAGVLLANGGMVEEVYLPDTITNLTLQNLSHLTTLEANDLSHVTSLRIENIDDSIIDGLEAVNEMADGGRVRLIGFNKTFESDDDFTELMHKMMTMRGIDSDGNNLDDAYLEGEVTIGFYDRAIYDYVSSHFPFLTVHYTTLGLHRYAYYITRNARFGTVYEDDTITNIRPYAFYSSAVEAVNIPNATSIGNCAFQSSKITEANFPNVTTVGSSAFQGSTITSVNMPKLTTISDSNATFRSTKLVRVYLPKLTTFTTSGTYTFANITTLKTAVLPVLTTRFADRAFESCSNLEAVDYGKYRDEYGNNYTLCPKLTTVVYRANSVSLMRQANEFAATPIGGLNGTYDGHIYVPESQIASYRTASNWSTLYANYPDVFKTIESTHTDPDAPIDLTLYYVDGTPIPT